MDGGTDGIIFSKNPFSRYLAISFPSSYMCYLLYSVYIVLIFSLLLPNCTLFICSADYKCPLCNWIVVFLMKTKIEANFLSLYDYFINFLVTEACEFLYLYICLYSTDTTAKPF